jgi:hypothetical protein
MKVSGQIRLEAPSYEDVEPIIRRLTKDHDASELVVLFKKLDGIEP